MSAPVHFDVAAYEQSARAFCATHTEQAIASNPMNADFLRLQQHFYELVISGSKMVMEATNRAETANDIAEALGIAIGTLQASFVMQAADGNPASAILLTERIRSTTAAILGGDSRAATGGTFHATVGGHA